MNNFITRGYMWSSISPFDYSLKMRVEECIVRINSGEWKYLKYRIGLAQAGYSLAVISTSEESASWCRPGRIFLDVYMLCDASEYGEGMRIIRSKRSSRLFSFWGDGF